MKVALGSLLILVAVEAAATGVVAYENGRIWTGSKFVEGSIFVAGGIIVDAPPPARIERRVDLAGAFVTPPFAEPHHHVTSPSAEASAVFTARGEFYVLNATSIVEPFQDSEAFFARPDTYDVLCAMGGLTLPGGHPERLYVEVLTQYAYPGWTRERFLGNAFHYADSLPATEAALDLLEAQGAGIIKTYLLHSEEFAARRDDPAYYGSKGLDPELFADIVRAIHKRNLRVITHVETEYDARVAARAGVDLLAHLPGYNPLTSVSELAPLILSDETVAALVGAGTAVISTYGLAAAGYARLDPGDEALQAVRPQHYALQRANIQKLYSAGVTVLLGTDGFTGVAQEAAHHVEIGAMTPTQALQAMTIGGRFIFPERELGCLHPGCEASFITFDEDPRYSNPRFAGPRFGLKQGVAL
ncbi:MAG: amidohydrolase family protein [Halieaceae bacterium]|nr:amidohydrolase family protein [Halieaceae bacterium]